MRVDLHPANVFEAEPHWEASTVAELFSRQAQFTPETPAIVFRDHLLTYRQMEEQSNQLAHFLHQHGVGPETVVSLCLERGVDALEHLIALLAVWKAGGAYLMVDPAYYPEEQMRSMLGNKQIRLILTQQRLQARLPGTPLASVVSLDAVQDEITACPTTAPLSRATPEMLAYVIYTSGSTGQPKGVLVEHRWLPYLAHEQIQLFQVRPGDRLSHLLAPSFDASLSEILTAWLAGATLYPAPLEALRPGPRMVAYLSQYHISLAHFTPSVLTALPDADLPALRTLVVGGEVCPAELAMRHTRWGRQVIVVYGLTETTVCNFGYRYPGDGSQPSLGHPFSYVQVEVWDEHGQPVAEGEPGQLVLAGPLARGYTDEAQTTARFIVRNGHRWCLTGDYGYVQADGTYRFLGRQDAQQKVAGYLLNLAAVEAILQEHPDVRDARAFLYGGRWIIAYVVLHQPGMLWMSELRAFLLPRLPGRALPACCIPLDALPLNAHGKASSRLEDYPTPRASDYQRFEEVFHAPETEAERTLAAMIQRQAENPLVAHDPQAVNILKSLPELGVDSLGMVGVELEIAEQFRVSHLTEEQLTTWPLYKLASLLTEQLPARSDQS